jgi:hypothetical protein
VTVLKCFLLWSADSKIHFTRVWTDDRRRRSSRRRKLYDHVKQHFGNGSAKETGMRAIVTADGMDLEIVQKLSQERDRQGEFSARCPAYKSPWLVDA